MRTIIRVTALSALALLLSVTGCATTPHHEYDEQVEFSSLRTFQWLEPQYGDKDVSVSHPVLDSPLLGQRVRRATVAALEEKGYRQVEENPDFYVTYHTAEGEEQRRASYVQLGYGRFSPHFGSSILLDVTPRSFREGTLIIDIVAAGEDELIWRGWRDAYLTQSNFEEERVNKAVRFILSAFPPGA